jgi:NTE family protein
MKIGLVLSGGGARGFAQIGVLKVLKENNIQIDAIAGCSIGALIGSCYAYDENPEAIEKLLSKINSKNDVYDYSFSLKGFIRGNKLEQYIVEYFKEGKDIKFSDLKKTLYINATDLVNEEEKVFNKGKLIPAIMASLSYPGFFTTRKIDDKLYVDGGVVNPLPTDSLTDMDYLILVDVSEESKDITEDSNIRDVMVQSTLIMQKTIVDLRLKNCPTKYILIKPNLTKISMFSFKNASKIINIGESEARKAIDIIKKDISG